MTHSDIIKQIRLIRPGAKFVLVGSSYEGLEWLDETQSKPTPEELGL